MQIKDYNEGKNHDGEIKATKSNRITFPKLSSQIRLANSSIELKDGAYYCYCAYVLRISRYSDFLSPMLTNTGIFFAWFKTIRIT